MHTLKRILVVDDDVAVASSLALALHSTGRTATIAAGAQQARAHLATGHYDCIISDWRMPDEDGLHFIASLHAQAQNQAPLTVLMSAYITADTHKLAKRAGCHELLCKPIDLQQLDDCLKRLAHKQQRSTTDTDTDVLPIDDVPELRYADDYCYDSGGIDAKADTEVYELIAVTAEPSPAAAPSSQPRSRRSQSLRSQRRHSASHASGLTATLVLVGLLAASLCMVAFLLTQSP